MPEPRLLTIIEAAKLLKVHPVTLRAKASRGEIPAAKPSHKWLFVDVDLIEYIRSQYKPKLEQKDGQCHSTNVKTQMPGGLKSSKTEESYAAALGLQIKPKLKNITTN